MELLTNKDFCLSPHTKLKHSDIDSTGASMVKPLTSLSFLGNNNPFHEIDFIFNSSILSKLKSYLAGLQEQSFISFYHLNKRALGCSPESSRTSYLAKNNYKALLVEVLTRIILVKFYQIKPWSKREGVNWVFLLVFMCKLIF